MQSAEIELKFPVHDLARLQARLPSLGFQLDTPRTFEQNTLYDTPDRILRAARQILRLRHYVTSGPSPTNARLTPPSRGSHRYKVRIETETLIEDGPALAAIFHQLGYEPVFRYEKFRTQCPSPTSPSTVRSLPRSGVSLRAFRIPSLVLDETPIGDYAELEGPPAWIDDTLAGSTSILLPASPTATQPLPRLEAAHRQPREHLTFDQIRPCAL